MKTEFLIIGFLLASILIALYGLAIGIAFEITFWKKEDESRFRINFSDELDDILDHDMKWREVEA